MDEERFSTYFALDGRPLDGLIGSAGILRFDWPEKKFYVQFYDGVSGGHNPSLSPDGKMALLGNFGQQVILLDITNPEKMHIIGRQATQYYEEIKYRLRSNTHHLWYPDSQSFIGAIGEHLYRFPVDRLKCAEQIGPHCLENAHELRWDSTHRWILMGDLGPEKHDVRQICVFDLQEPIPEKRAKVIGVMNNVWHVCVHPTKPVGYAFTYSLTTDNDDWVEWSPFYAREYIYEIDLPTAKITRVWNSAAEFPIHLNSDVDCSADNRLYVASGGSHAVVEIPLDTFDQSIVHPHIPSLWARISPWRQKIENLLGSLARRASYSSTHYMLQTLRITGWRIMDGVYAARVSPQGKYVVVGNRGYNVVSVYERETFKEVYSKILPFRRARYKRRPPQFTLGWTGYHLGIHHSEVTPR